MLTTDFETGYAVLGQRYLVWIQIWANQKQWVDRVAFPQTEEYMHIAMFREPSKPFSPLPSSPSVLVSLPSTLPKSSQAAADDTTHKTSYARENSVWNFAETKQKFLMSPRFV